MGRILPQDVWELYSSRYLSAVRSFPTKAHAHYFCFKDYNHAVTRSDSNNQNKVVLLHVKNYSCAYIKVSAH